MRRRDREVTEHSEIIDCKAQTVASESYCVIMNASALKNHQIIGNGT